MLPPAKQKKKRKKQGSLGLIHSNPSLGHLACMLGTPLASFYPCIRLAPSCPPPYPPPEQQACCPLPDAHAGVEMEREHGRVCARHMATTRLSPLRAEDCEQRNILVETPNLAENAVGKKEEKKRNKRGKKPLADLIKALLTEPWQDAWPMLIGWRLACNPMAWQFPACLVLPYPCLVLTQVPP